MPTGSLGLDIIVNKVIDDLTADTEESVDLIRKRFPSLTDKEINEIYKMIASCAESGIHNDPILVVTAPPSFGIKAKSTKYTVDNLINEAEKSILITGYSLSDYFSDLTDVIIRKSLSGVLVQFFVNNIDDQNEFEKLLRYKSKYLRIYNYPKQSNDNMSALHAKVICIDNEKTLVTSANLSYHGQQGNIEIGSLIESKQFAAQIHDMFSLFVKNRVFEYMK